MKSILVKNYSAIENSLRYYLHKDIEIRYMSSHNSSFIEYKLFSYSTMNPYNPPSVVRPLFSQMQAFKQFSVFKFEPAQNCQNNGPFILHLTHINTRINLKERRNSDQRTTENKTKRMSVDFLLQWITVKQMCNSL